MVEKPEQVDQLLVMAEGRDGKLVDAVQAKELLTVVWELNTKPYVAAAALHVDTFGLLPTDKIATEQFELVARVDDKPAKLDVELVG